MSEQVGGSRGGVDGDDGSGGDSIPVVCKIT